MTSYTSVFNGNVIQPSSLSYISVNLNQNRTLSWPTQFQNTNFVVATIIDVVPTNNGFILTVPDARDTSVGQSILINNPTGFTFILNKNDGTLLANIAASSLNFFWLIDNTTQGGSWRNGPFGGGYAAVTSIAAVSNTPNITITPGIPITTVGTFTFNVGADLLALTSFNNGTGIAARTAANTWALRSVVGTNNQIIVTNPAGIAGNMTFSLAPTITGINSITSGNINLTANTISSTNLNGNINLAPNGNGSVTVQSGNAIAFYNPINSNYISFEGGNLVSDITLIWPTAAPLSGQVMGYSGANQLAWLNVSTFGGPSTLNALARYANTTGQLANSGVLLDNSNNLTGINSALIGNIGIGNIDANTISTTNANGNLTLFCNGSGEVRSFSNIVLDSAKQLKFYNAGNTAYNFLSGANVTVTTGWALPATDGSTNSFMKTDGTNNLSFSTAIVDVIATEAELEANPPVNTNHPVVPSVFHHHRGVAKLEAVFDGTAGSPSATFSYNLTSITKNATGDYTLTPTTNFANANIKLDGMLNGVGFIHMVSLATNAIRIITKDAAGAAADFSYVSVGAYGLQ